MAIEGREKRQTVRMRGPDGRIYTVTLTRGGDNPHKNERGWTLVGPDAVDEPVKKP